MIIQVLLLTLSYFVSSVPTGYWLAKYFFGVDITRKGSGNIGATNVARVLGDTRFFFLIFFLDFLKAAGFLWMCKYLVNNLLSSNFLFIIAVGLLIGNAHSVFLRFSGGKGVATTFGILTVLYPGGLVILFLLIWLFILMLAKQVDVASLASFFSLLVFSFLIFPIFSVNFLFLIFVNFWIWIRHKENIKNILASLFFSPKNR